MTEAKEDSPLVDFFESMWGRFVVEHPKLSLQEAAQAYISAQIFGPYKSLGLNNRLSPGDLRGVRAYAEAAKEALLERVHFELSNNSYLIIDQRLAELSQNVTVEELRQVEEARSNLRALYESTFELIDKCQRSRLGKNLNSEELIARACRASLASITEEERQARKGYFYTTIYAGVLKTPITRFALGIDNWDQLEEDFIKKESGEIYNLETNLDGVYGHVYFLKGSNYEDKSDNAFWMEFGVTFSEARVALISKCRPLPPLKL